MPRADRVSIGPFRGCQRINSAGGWLGDGAAVARALEYRNALGDIGEPPSPPSHPLPSLPSLPPPLPSPPRRRAASPPTLPQRRWPALSHLCVGGDSHRDHIVHVAIKDCINVDGPYHLGLLQRSPGRTCTPKRRRSPAGCCRCARRRATWSALPSRLSAQPVRIHLPHRPDPLPPHHPVDQSTAVQSPPPACSVSGFASRQGWWLLTAAARPQEGSRKPRLPSTGACRSPR